jgi:hypothetical protein
VKRLPAKKRGVATIRVDDLQKLGFKIYGDLALDPTHVCGHCADCNGAEQDCVPVVARCPLLKTAGLSIEDQQEMHSIRKKLVTGLFIRFDATFSKEELLVVFANDFSETNKTAANDEYERRLDSHRSSKIRLTETIDESFEHKPILAVDAGYTPPISGKLLIEGLPQLSIDLREKQFTVDIPHANCDPKRMQQIMDDGRWHEIELSSLSVNVASQQRIRIYRFTGRIVAHRERGTVSTLTFDKFGDVTLLWNPPLEKMSPVEEK